MRKPVCRRLLVTGTLSAALLAPAAGWSANAAPSGQEAQMGPLTMVQVRAGGAPLRRDADQPSISADGRYVTYRSGTTQVAHVHRNGHKQVLRYDRQTGKTVLVSVTPDGQAGKGDSFDATMSADGQVVVFSTLASNLLPGTPELHDYVIAARDMQTGQTTLVSQTPAGDPPNNQSRYALVSDDGSLVGFRTDASDITGQPGAVIYDRRTGTSSAVTVDTSSGDIVVRDA